MSNNKENQQEDFPVEEGQITDFSQLINEHAFLGEYPAQTIFEGIQTQFEDYINISDKTNYVDIFFNQMDISLEATTLVYEEHPKETKDVLLALYHQFVDHLRNLFETRLTITIPELVSDTVCSEDLEYIIRRLYEFFILDARNNFKVVISKDLNKQLDKGANDYFQQIQELINNTYSPLITSITPAEFLRYRGDTEIINLFENSQVVGNFLRKYSPKLYQNEEFSIELVNYITSVKEFHDGVIDDKIPEGEYSDGRAES